MELDKIGSIVAILLSVLSLYKAWRMAPKEVQSVDAEAANKYASASSATAQQNERLTVRIDELNARLDESATKMDSLENELTQNKVKISVLEKKLVDSERKVVVLENLVGILNKKLKRRDVLIADWQHGINILLGQMCEANIPPAWTPPSFIDDEDERDM